MRDILIACALGVWFLLVALGMLYWIRRELIVAVSALDQNVAQAITKILEELPIGDFEPPNPVQAFILDIMRDQIGPKKTIHQNREPNGQFIAESEPKSEK